MFPVLHQPTMRCNSTRTNLTQSLRSEGQVKNTGSSYSGKGTNTTLRKALWEFLYRKCMTVV
jgi:hypothetical protein